MNKLILIALLLVLIGCQNTSTTSCECTDLKSETDCSSNKLSKKCSWDTKASACIVQPDTTTPTTTATTSIYCTGILEADCAGTTGCAWVNKACTHFTGCTPFKLAIFEECQAISKSCLTDGTHCVPKDLCSTYKQQKSCNELGLQQICHWDDTAKTCSDADTCEKLPTSFITDKQCRAGKITCTTNGQGCILSGNTCADQTTEISCVWDLNKNKVCNWDSTRTDSKFCQEKTCENAPTSYTTHLACQSFLDNKSCTVRNDKKGCRTINACGDATISEGCVINNSNKPCYWQTDKSTCVLLECSVAPTTITSNSKCEEFAPNQNCITKSNGGCVTNGACSAATTSDACKTNISKQACFWDTSATPNACKELICQNLPISLVQAQDCSGKLSSCTLNPSTSKGCVTKTCDNAPSDTSDCEAYLSKSNCIKKKAGGCTTLTNCASITIDTLCTKDVNSKVCYWNPDTSACVDLTCDNLAASLTKHEDCNGKLPSCTNKSGGGCQTQTCENSITQTLCNATTCKWKGDMCFDRTCSLAGKNNHNDCNDYLSSCTFNLDKNATTGCALIPLRCDAIFNEEACKKKKVVSASGTVSYANCGWDGTKCIDAGCTTLSKTYTTTAVCQTNGSTFVNCVSANPDGLGVVAGCIALPASCSERKASDNCEQRFGGTGAKCIWDVTADPKKCVDRACATASLAGTTDKVSTFTNDNCKTYLDGCIANNAADGCIAKPSSCSGLVSANCLDGAKSTGDCYWKTDTCVDKTCENVLKTNHTDCYAVKINSKDQQCTVSADEKSCMTIKAKCTDYADNENACVVNSNGDTCVFDGTCRAATCKDALLTTSFDTHDECNSYVSKCTPLNNITTCQPKASSCSDYLIDKACVSTNAGVDCVWGGKTCYIKSTFDCTKIYIDGEYTDAGCEGIFYKCKMDDKTKCKAKSCADYKTKDGKSGGSVLSANKDCSDLDSTCAINVAKSACQDIKASCSSYDDTSCTIASTDGACTSNTEAKTCAKAGLACSNYKGSSDAICGAQRDFCKADASATAATACVSKGCSAFTGTAGDFDHSKCQAKDTSCTANNDGSACIDAKSCETYATTQTSCAFNTSGKSCFWDAGASPAATCITLSNSTCSKITGKTGLKRSDCQAYSTTCTVNRAATACVQIKDTCVGVDIADCQESTTQLCVQNQATDSGATCANFTTGTACNLIYVKSGTYSHEICNKLNSTCTNNSTTACTAKTCANATTQTSYKDCNDWLNTCTWDGNTSCVAIKATCAEQTKALCYQSKEGECFATADACVKLDCSQKTSPISNKDCIEFSTTCAIAPVGGCQAYGSTCSSYKAAIQCVKSTAGDCYWNPINKTCVDFTCTNLEQTTNFNTNDKCKSVTNANTATTVTISCAIRNNADYSAIANGCIELTDCTSYKIAEQCKNDKKKKLCEWLVTDTSKTCVYKSCTTAPSSLATHGDCNGYFSDSDAKITCTVYGSKDADGKITYSGCIQTGACNTYNFEKQCEVSDKGDDCDWNGTTCDIKSCATADPTKYTTFAGCQGYFSNKCTVQNTAAGCMDIPDTCEELKLKDNCQTNKAGVACYWDEDNTKCITPSCSNAPTSFITNKTCKTYLNTCDQDSDIPCKTLVCEDFTEKTDDACKTKLPNQVCTTDGTKCVKRGTCKAALVDVACTFNSTLGLCQWDSTNKYCVDMNCGTAPVATYTSDTQCAGYYIAKKCMAKSGGGCADRTICTSIKVQDACTNAIGDVNGTLCSWDGGNCRFQNCTDFSGTTHLECQGKFQKGTCTAGANSKCAAVTTCDATTIQAACVQGTDGPCLWVSGKCYAYKKCESISFPTDPQCKVISSNCSVNTSLNKCVPITSCTESNINDGCVTGYDGECIMSKNDTGKICKVKQSCADAAFQTDDDCQRANVGCTTNGTTCIELADCSTYKEAGCKRNKAGASEKITGRCNWDATAQTCHDETCSEIITGTTTTHAGCYSQLKTCSSNGTKCVNLSTCDKYEIADGPCNAAKGTDLLPCFYEAASATNNNVALCRTKKCADITDLALCPMSELSCVSDGTKCISKAACSTYTAKAACNSGGSDGDGICIWKAGTTAGTGVCSKVTSCATADQDACSTTFMKKYCYWKSTTTGTTTTSACAPHTCASYQTYNGNQCASYKVYGGATQQICALDAKSVCTETDPTKLISGTCFSQSNYVYTWNAVGNTCQQCKGSTVQPGNNSSAGNDSNTTTDSGYILGFASIIFGYALF